jgi:flagellar biosynthesis/type III secretory pathway chaperone
MTTQIEQITKPYDSFVEQLRFLHKQSLACLRMIEIAEDDEERDRWVSEYTDNQIELMNLQQVNRAL